MDFREKRTKFMQGRNGVDSLSRFLAVLSLVLFALAFILSFVSKSAAAHIQIFSLIIFAVSVYRIVSRKLYRRQRENRIFLFLKKRVMSNFKLISKIYSDRKTHVYKKCPMCKNVLRLPRKNGMHTVLCPVCKNRFEVRIKENSRDIFSGK